MPATDFTDLLAAFYNDLGPPNVIRVGNLPTPEINEYQVLVKVHATSVNPIDCYLRGGLVPHPGPFPYVVGCDLAGVVIAIGSQVSDLVPGERVWSATQGLLGRQGTSAEYCAVDRDYLYRTPENVSDEEIAALGLVGVTAYLGLVLKCKLQANESVAVIGGGGAIGQMVIQMAVALGARVVAATSSSEKMNLCRNLGAELVVDYRDLDWSRMIAEKFGPIDVCWETSRFPNLMKAVPMMAENGRILLMAGREAVSEMPIGPFYVRQLSMLGLVVFKNSADEIKRAAEAVNQWAANGQIRAHISHRFPLHDAAAAHELQQSNTLDNRGTVSGKIVLSVTQ